MSGWDRAVERVEGAVDRLAGAVSDALEAVVSRGAAQVVLRHGWDDGNGMEVSGRG